MSKFRRARVTEVRRWDDGIVEAKLDFDGVPGRPGLVLKDITAPVEAGDEVIVNVTAVELGLGTGGYHFVLWNLSRDSLDTGAPGHIMKLRYTPLQFNFEAVEERLGITEGDLRSELLGMPVIAGSVHSQLMPAIVSYKEDRPGGRPVYIMTDGGCLPLKFSNTVRFLKREGYIAGTITCGQAFGGDAEAVSIYGALSAARREFGATVAVVIMGPGILGTGSSLGFTGLEQAVTINAAGSLGGRPVAIARISFKDTRERHYGLSHHSRTILGVASLTPAVVPIPLMEEEKHAAVMKTIEGSGIKERGHQIVEVDARRVIDIIKASGFGPTTMEGRTMDDEPEYFMAAGAAGLVAAGMEEDSDES